MRGSLCGGEGRLGEAEELQAGVVRAGEGGEGGAFLTWGNEWHHHPRPRGRNRMICATYGVKPWDGFRSILALNNRLLVGPVPVLKLGGQLQLNHLQVPKVIIPGQVAVHTDDIHVRCLGREHESLTLHQKRWKSQDSPTRGPFSQSR